MQKQPDQKQRVLILGGGFAGLSAALELSPDLFEVTLIDRHGAFEFLPNIHELLSGVKTPELLRLSLEQTLSRAGHRFIQDTVTAIDVDNGCVQTEDQTQPHAYDVLIVALGGIDATRGVPGVVEHALPFKSVDQCARIGARLKQLAEAEDGADVIVVGGGLEGVEALGEILRAHRRSPLRLHMVEARGRLLAEAPPSLDAHLRELCRPHRVGFSMNSPVERIEPDSVVLKGGRTIPSDLTIWTGGPAPPPLLADSGLATPGEWALVHPTLQAVDHPNVFIAGDLATLPEPVVKQGYHAIDMGVRAARNAALLSSGDSLEPFTPSGKPSLISFGDLTCFLVADGRALAGPALGAAKEAVFEIVMAQLDVQPAAKRVHRAIERADRAVRSLLWPTVSSFSTLLAQGRVKLL